MSGVTVVRAAVSIAAVLLATAMLGGCFEPPRPWHDALAVSHWNRSDLILSIKFETNVSVGEWWPFWPAGKDDTPENDHGHATFSGCNLSDPTWLRVRVGNSTTNYFESFYWSDVGCRVTYDLNYYGPGNLTMVVSGMDPTIEQRTDLPRP